MATVGTNSYISLLSFKAWANSFGHDLSAFTDPDIEAATVRTAINFIDPNYTFKGTVLVVGQAMQLPTTEVVIADIENGAAQAVWQEINGYLFVAMNTQSANGQVASENKKIGSLSKSVSYVEGTSQSSEYSTTVIDNLLRPLTCSLFILHNFIKLSFRHNNHLLLVFSAIFTGHD